MSAMEDEDGLMKVIVKPDVYGRYHEALRNCLAPVVDGPVSKEVGILKILTEALHRSHRRQHFAGAALSEAKELLNVWPPRRPHLGQPTRGA